jgi:hypothetical protein
MKPMNVRIEEGGRLCAAGHILAEILDENLARPDLAPRFKGLDLVIHFRAGRMKFTVIFKGGELEVREGHIGRASVRIRGPFSALLKLALRKIPFKDILLLRVLVFGNYIKLYQAGPLLQHHDPIPPGLVQDRRIS